jgi:hypothetical protein
VLRLVRDHRKRPGRENWAKQPARNRRETTDFTMTTPEPDFARQIGDLQVALNIVWTLLCGFLVMFMQAGFALVESGLTRAKSIAHTIGMNFLVYAIGIVGFWPWVSLCKWGAWARWAPSAAMRP